ncbi:hypothetical protein JHK87_022338 [Glycine soja]|nr:hypothetical protein JHK87_022338 [Glycine soja]
MARIPNKNKSIDGSKETLKLAVRITDLWFVGTPNKSEQAEMVFVDSEGDQIHAICKSDHLKSWKADLKENCTYVMHNFKVVKNDGQFRVCEHEYKLFFIGVTVVREADLHELPFKEFRFVEFANVVASNFVSGMLQLPTSVTQCLIHCGDHMTILRRFGPPLQWNVVVLDKGIGDKYVTLPWYKFLQEGDFSHGDELSFYHRRAEKIWEVVIRRAIDWDDSDID